MVLFFAGFDLNLDCEILGEFLVGDFLSESVLIRWEVLKGFSRGAAVYAWRISEVISQLRESQIANLRTLTRSLGLWEQSLVTV